MKKQVNEFPLPGLNKYEFSDSKKTVIYSRYSREFVAQKFDNIEPLE